MNHDKKYFYIAAMILSIIGALIYIGFVTYPGPALAQTAPASWNPPVNLSQSGSTSKPAIVVDSNQHVHVIWLDTYSDYGYAAWDGENWSAPVGLTYGFYPEIPTLLPGPNGLVHVFWVTDSGALLYSKVAGDSMGNPASFSSSQVLAGAILNFNVNADEQGNLHLSYIQGPNDNGLPTGVYYRQADPTGSNWSIGKNIYTSPYFRSMTTDNTHVYSAATQVDGTARVYVAFDNAATKRVYLAISDDNGASWNEPLEIDKPDNESVTTTPFNIMVYPQQQNILVMWQNTLQSSFDCTQFYQYSTDGGTSWSTPDTTFDELVGCPTGNTFFAGPDNHLLLMTEIQDSTYIQAWNWEQWSDPQVQTGLDQFTDPVTYSDLPLADKKAAMGADFRLYVAGSDVVENKDTWVTYKDLSDITSWYPPPQAWSQPEVVSSTVGEIHDPVLLSDASGLEHLFWSQSSDPENPQKEWEIYYSRFDGNAWIPPVGIIKSPDKFATKISAAVDSNRKIYVVWTGATTGEIYFAWAESDKADSTFEWSDPQSLPQPPNVAADPQIVAGSNNALYVIYTVPINEGRGVYLIESTDQGENWTEPMQLFDGASANWNMVGKARLTQAADGSLHVLFSQKSILDGDVSTALYYTNSVDDGQTWSSPTLAIDQSVIAYDILAADQLTIHRYWQTDASDDSSIWHEVSLDAGLTWITSAPISVLGTPGPSAIVLDSLNRLHLLQRFEDPQGHQFLQHWEWSGNGWEAQQNLDLSKQIDHLAVYLGASVSDAGRLQAASQESQVDPATGSLTNYLFATSRLLDNQASLVTPVVPEQNPTQTPTPDLVISIQETPGPAETLVSPAPTQISFQGSEDIKPPTSSITYLIIGVGTAFIFMVILIVIMRLRGR
jgi:hypothetical protein